MNVLCMADGTFPFLNSLILYRSIPRIEVPPRMLGEPKPGDEEEEVLACLAASYSWFRRRIVIKLADEGLSVCRREFPLIFIKMDLIREAQLNWV